MNTIHGQSREYIVGPASHDNTMITLSPSASSAKLTPTRNECPVFPFIARKQSTSFRCDAPTLLQGDGTNSHTSEEDQFSTESSPVNEMSSLHLQLPSGALDASTDIQLTLCKSVADISMTCKGAEAVMEASMQFKRQPQWRCTYGVASDQGIRSSMEDEHVAFLRDDCAFFGVYDGHGGSQCSRYVKENLHRNILSHPSLMSNSLEAISSGVAATEATFLNLCDESLATSGCVCAVVLIRGGEVFVGNVGDCEAVLFRQNSYALLTEKHTPASSEAEAARVVAAGGTVFNRRVGHPRFNPRLYSLAVSRALGDAGFKLDCFTDRHPSGLIADAYTTAVKLSPGDSFIILACDGFWDAVSYDAAMAMGHAGLLSGEADDAKAMADKLVSAALERGSRDNVTVVFIRLHSSSEVL